MSGGQQRHLGPPGRVRLHHVGFVLDSIQENAKPLALSLGATWDGHIIYDPIQKVRVSFLRGTSPFEAMIELVEPVGVDSPVAALLKRGGGLHHLCYEIEDLDAYLVFCKSMKMSVLRKPTPAVAFDGRRIAWVLGKKRLLIEYLESKVAGVQT